MLFPFICMFDDKATAYTSDGGVVKLNNLYSELSVELCEQHWDGR